ncbi:hypothetical protein F4778DRAFT_723636 [Xylariomycetidae sp. FL2044]|nr:hypothetical protein F4778DRAFT_723636 [Xylariomycetidae sp. FL2044]
MAPSTVSALSFGRVMEGRPISSVSSTLFTIPNEIVPLILEYVATDKNTLASLACVNSDFRQLARSYQFHTVGLTSSSRRQLFDLLQVEALQRLRSPLNLTRSASLGACIRKLYVECGSCCEGWRDRHEFLGSLMPSEPRTRNGQDPDGHRVRMIKALKRSLDEDYQCVCKPATLLVIPTLPNLQELALVQEEFDDELLDTLMGSSIKHLNFEISPKSIPSERTTTRVWPLESLNIDSGWHMDLPDLSPDGVDPSGLYRSLLTPCCSTLRHLGIISKPGGNDVAISFNLDFPLLQSLRIGWQSLLQEPTLMCLLRESLIDLRVPYDDLTIRQALNKINHVRSLKTLVFSGWEPTKTSPIRLIKLNPQIEVLAIPGQQGDGSLRHIIQALSNHRNLKTLSLGWDEEAITGESLNGLALLSGLEALHLRALSIEWYVNHSQLVECLKPLKNLRRLIITGDAYIVPHENQFWQEMEEMRGRTYAREYFQAFPKLECVHFGGFEFTIQQQADASGGCQQYAHDQLPEMTKSYLNSYAGQFHVRDAWIDLLQRA